MKIKKWVTAMIIMGCIGIIPGCANTNGCNSCQSTVNSCTTDVQQTCDSGCGYRYGCANM